jgi:hypothetical protein
MNKAPKKGEINEIPNIPKRVTHVMTPGIISKAL